MEAKQKPVAWIWRDGYHVAHVSITEPPEHIKSEPVYAAPASDAHDDLVKALDALFNAADGFNVSGVYFNEPTENFAVLMQARAALIKAGAQ